MTPGAEPAVLLLERLWRMVILDYEYENEYENENENGRRGPRGLPCTPTAPLRCPWHPGRPTISRCRRLRQNLDG